MVVPLVDDGIMAQDNKTHMTAIGEINNVSIDHNGVQPTGCIDIEVEPSHGNLC